VSVVPQLSRFTPFFLQSMLYIIISLVADFQAQAFFNFHQVMLTARRKAPRKRFA
jgi:hypothetical protein